MLGADPDKKSSFDSSPDAEWWGGKPQKKKGLWGDRSPVEHLAWRFYTHPNQRMTSVMNVTEKDSRYIPILRSTFRRLLAEGYTVPDLQNVVEKFWATPAAQRSGFPILTFANKRFQRSLLSGTYVTSSNAILSWITNNFNRQDDSLPWDEDRDAPIKDAIMFDGMDALYSYPELVAEIVTIHEDPSDALVELSTQLQWNWGQVDDQSLRLLELVPTVPGELLKKGKARTKKASIFDAIAASQGA